MFDARRMTHPAGLLPVALSFLMLFAVACGAPDPASETAPQEPAPESPPQDEASDPPPRSDTITALSQFLVCEGNPYALCYYSGPEGVPPDTTLPVPALPCELGDDGQVANCKCYALEHGEAVNYVALPSILNPEVLQATVDQCGEDGSGCLNMTNENDCASDSTADGCSPAPVCGYLGNVAAGTGQTLYPEGTLISTFSMVNSNRYPINSTDCSEEPYLRYAGCMTAGCGEPYTENGESFVDCACPTFVGPFQFGQENDALDCDLGDSNVWSAANVTVPMPPLLSLK